MDNYHAIEMQQAIDAADTEDDRIEALKRYYSSLICNERVALIVEHVTENFADEPINLYEWWIEVREVTYTELELMLSGEVFGEALRERIEWSQRVASDYVDYLMSGV